MIVKIIFFMRLSVDQININKEFMNEYEVFNLFCPGYNFSDLWFWLGWENVNILIFSLLNLQGTGLACGMWVLPVSICFRRGRILAR